MSSSSSRSLTPLPPPTSKMGLSAQLRLLAVVFACTNSKAVPWTREGSHRMLAKSKRAGDARIIGGKNADPTRYPYMVALFGQYSCAGTLIARDIILSAGHCFADEENAPGAALIGDYDVIANDEDSEVHIFQEVLIHPRYYAQTQQRFPDEHDYTLLKIFDTANAGSIVKLNADPTVPDSTPKVPLYILGWGATNATDPDSDSTVLKEADVSFVPNDVCSQVRAFDDGVPYSLENMVFNITLCAADFNEGEDSCSGDSGGPILLLGRNADEDLQLGVISYGALECGHPEIPAVHARVSYVYDWIRDNVCRMSLDPPAYFECESSVLSNEPDLSGEMIQMTLEFVADAYADEVGWIVQSPNDSGTMISYAYGPIKTYPRGSTGTGSFNLSTTFSIPNNRYYRLTMLDSWGDGFGGGDLTLKLSTADTIILNKTSPFNNYTISFDFVLGTLPTASPTVTPAPSISISPSMMPTTTPPTVWVVIKFDDYPGETGWRIEALHDNGETEILKEEFPGTYEDMTSISEAVRLLPATPMTYRFTMTDNEANGICCKFGEGSYELWLGEPGEGELLVRGQDFVWEIAHEFVVEKGDENSVFTSTTRISSAVSIGVIRAAILWTGLMVLAMC